MFIFIDIFSNLIGCGAVGDKNNFFIIDKFLGSLANCFLGIVEAFSRSLYRKVIDITS